MKRLEAITMSMWKRRGPVLGLVTVWVLATAYVLAMPVAESTQPMPAGIPDLSTIATVELRSGNTVVLSGQFGAEVQDESERKRTAALTPAAGAKGTGNAEIEYDADDRQNQELEIEVSGLDPRSAYDVFLDGHAVGGLKTDARGRGELELERITHQ